MLDEYQSKKGCKTEGVNLIDEHANLQNENRTLCKLTTNIQNA